MAEELNLSEQSLDSNPTQTSDFSSDLSFLENFSPALAAKPEAINIYKQSVGNPITGSNPAAKVSTIDNSDAINSILNNSISKVEKGGDNPYERMRPFTYNGDYDGANFERYYSTDAYKTLGFSPYRDNDALYNQKMTMGDQFVRAASQWDNLALTGFKSGVKSWGTLFTDPLAPDIQGAKEMERAMAIGSVTTGGFGGFAANTFLNSAYTIGIAGEFLAEELALTAATAFSGGLLGEVTIPGMVAKAGAATRQFLKLGELGAKLGKTGEKFAEGKKVFEAGETLANIGKNIDKSNNVASTRDFFNKAVTGVFDVINPLENTVNAFRKSDYATDLAKTIGRSGAFIDDIIHIKTAVSEAQLEGGMVKINATKELIDQYRKENGRDPEGQELNNIEMLASEEARRTAFWNLPAIMTSNKLLYSTMMLPISKMMGKASTRLIEDIVAEGGVKALGKDMFKVVGESAGDQIKAAAKSLAKPKIYGQYGMNYLKANFAEGIQENIQEAISQGAIQHALATQSDPRMAAYQGYMGYFLDGMKSQLSAQGAETFAGGFAMGMFAQPIMAAPAWAASKSVDLFKDKTKLAEAKAIRDTALNAQRDTLNDLANNDLKYWAPDIMNAVKNGSLSDDLFAAARVGDHKSTKDSKDNIQFNHIATAIQSGKFETLMEKLADYKNLTPDEAFDVLQKYGIGVTTKEEAAKALDYIDDVISRANQIKNDYEDVAQSFPNPVNISQYEKGTPVYNAAVTSYLAWEEAKTNLVFAKNTYKTYSNRVKGMTDAFSTLSNGIANVDAQAVMSTLSTSGLQTEIQTLKKEIGSLTDIPEQASVRKDKEKKLELLQNFQESIKEAQDKITSENITDYLEKQKVYIKAKKDFQKFLTYLAKKNDNILFNSDADKAFGLLTDTLEMKNEMQGLANSINILSDPRGFVNLQSRIYEALEADKPNRVNNIANNLNNFLLMKDENEVLVELGKQGLKLPENFLKKYKEALEAGEELPIPEYFIDPQTGEELTPESNPEKYEKAKDLWVTFKAWLELNNPPKPKATEVEESPEAVAGEEEYKTFSPELKATIDSIYKDANAKESIGSFIKTNPDAILAIKLAKTQENLEQQEADAALNATRKEEGIPLGTKVNPEARANLNLMGYTNTQIDSLSREDREKILLGGITPEEFYKSFGFEALGNIGNQGLAIMEAELLKTGKHIISNISRATPEQRTQINNNIEELKKKYPEKDITSRIENNILIVEADKKTKPAEVSDIEEKRKKELASIKGIKKISKGKVSYAWTTTDGVDVFSYDDAVSEEEVKNKINDKYNKLKALEQPAEKVVIEEPVKTIIPEYEGKIIFITPGSGKEDLAKQDKDIIDADDILIETIKEIKPEFPIDEKLEPSQNIYDAIRYGGVSKDQLYNITRAKLKQMAESGKTILTSSVAFMKDSDYVMIQQNKDLIKKDYDMMKEYTELNNLPSTINYIAVTQTASEALKKTPMELLGRGPLELAKDVETEPVTIEDLNKNLTVKNLQIAMDKGYDAVYKNSRYAITNVEENSVSLKAIDGTTMKVTPEEISSVVNSEAVQATEEQIDIFDANQKSLKTGGFELNDDIDDLDNTLNDINNNLCD